MPSEAAAADTPALDAGAFRRALGSFATGVAIITTVDADGEPVGLTVNSFNSVSLNPPLVLWSLDNRALSLPAFRDGEYWAVHILASDQEALSTRFATRGENKFAGLDIESGLGGIPLLPGCAARFQCRTASQYQGGDHLIFIGEVQTFDHYDNPPLVFHGGRYAHATQRLKASSRHAALSGSFGDDFLGYLLGRSHFRFFAQIRRHLESAGLSDEEFYLLSSMTLKPAMQEDDLKRVSDTVLRQGHEPVLHALLARELVAEGRGEDPGKGYVLTPAGRSLALQLISAAKAVEAQALSRLGPDEDVVLKSLLNQLLAVLDPEATELWPKSDEG